MTNHVILAIGRQFGSGGHEIGNKVAERLDIPLYDRNLIRMAAQELKIDQEKAEEVDESGLSRFLACYAASPLEYSGYYMKEFQTGQPLSERVFEAQSGIMKRLASRGPCVLVGRCADYILSGEPGLVSVFICAEQEDKVKRIMEKYGLSERKAADRIRKVDRERRYYYELHTGNDWGSAGSHHVVLNASMLGVDGAVDFLAAMYEAKYRELNKE